MRPANFLAPLVAWWTRNRELHGSEMLLMLSYVYFTQGARSYIDRMIKYIFLREIGGSTGSLTGMLGAAHLAWTQKWALGLFFDNFPIWGYTVKPYLLLAALLGIIAQPLLGIPAVTGSVGSIGVVFSLVQTYGAVADVLADALVVKTGRKDEQDASSGLQALSWFSLGVGACLSNLIGGVLVTAKDGDGSGGRVADLIDTGGARWFMLGMTVMPCVMFFLVLRIKEEKTPLRPGFQAFRRQAIRLFNVFFSRPFLVLRCAIWSVVSAAASFDLDTPYTAFQVDVCRISPYASSIISCLGYACLSVGVVIYYKYFRRTSFRRIFFCTQAIYGVCCMSDYILVKRYNQLLGIPDVFFLAGADALAAVVTRLNIMPGLILAAQLCPEHAEATFFALMTSVANAGGGAAQLIGGAVQSAYGMTEGQWDGLDRAMLWRSLAIVASAWFALLVPDISALDPVNVSTSALRNDGPTARLAKFAELADEEGKFEMSDKSAIRMKRRHEYHYEPIKEVPLEMVESVGELEF